jgi:hypothetical protein
MNNNEQNIAISISGLMTLNITKENAYDLIKESDYCVGCDVELVWHHLDDILNGKDVSIQLPTDFPEDLFKL